jgi:protein ImuB
LRPELKRRELILYAPDRGCLRVVTTSKRGIAIGMPLAEAMALAPSTHFEQHDPGADRAALLELAAWCEQFSPVVGIEPPDNLCLDVTGLGSLFGGEESLAQQIARTFQRRGYEARLAIADTLGAAWALAHDGQESPIISPRGKTATAITELPMSALRLSSEAVEILTELGIGQIGQLLKLRRDALAARFDLQLLLRLDQALGLVAETIISHRPPPEIVLETQLEYPTDDRQAMDVILEQLIERIAQMLIERQQGAIQLECQLKCETSEPTSFTVGLFRASAHAKHLLELVQMRLERIVLAAPVIAVKMSVLMTARLQTWQPELFEPSRRESRREVGLLVDRLSNRLGREAVVRAMPQADAQPELAFRYEPLAGVAERKNQKSRWKSLPRPLRLEREPLRLEVLSVVPDGPPIQFQLHGQSHRVAKSWGPERIQTGWWRRSYVQRDYYRIETRTGKRFWLFRRLNDAKWFLHGEFD